MHRVWYPRGTEGQVYIRINKYLNIKRGYHYRRGSVDSLLCMINLAAINRKFRERWRARRRTLWWLFRGTGRSKGNQREGDFRGSEDFSNLEIL